MALAANELARVGGGQIVIQDGESDRPSCPADRWADVQRHMPEEVAQQAASVLTGFPSAVVI